jgi:putative NADH-flavin reductase
MSELKLIVFGASGLLGSRLVDEALGRGHLVTAVARDSERLDGRDARVAAASADVTVEQEVAAVSAGSDVALSAVTQHAHPAMLVAAARGLLGGLERAGVGRLVVAGGAGSLIVGGGTRLVDTPEFHDEWKPEALAQADALEVYRSYDGPVTWSYVSPGAVLEPGERTGRYRTGDDQLLTDEHGHSRITMEDFAIAMLDEAEHSRHPRRRFTASH